MAKNKYNLLGAIRAMDAGNKVGGLEGELSAEMETLRGKKCEHGGILLPDPELCRAANVAGPLAFRTAGQETFGTPETGVISGIGGHGSYAIATDLRLDMFIDALTARTVFGKVGVQVLDGLVGDLAIPVGGTVDAAWISTEGGESGKKNPTLAQRTATPHTLAAYTEITRKLFLQTGGAAEAFVVGILQNAMARAIETAGFKGSGTSGEPLGLGGTSGVQTVTGITPGAVTKADLVNFWSAMETENANTDAAAWVLPPAAKGLLCKTLDYTTFKEDSKVVAAVAAAHHLCEGGKCEDYPVFTSNLCDNKTAYFGDWSQLLFCAWRGTEIMVDRYSQSITGATRIVAFNDCDFIVRQPKAFVKGTVLS